jgi:hypothetical protein
MATRFRTKRVEIEATQFTGENFEEMYDWTEYQFRPVELKVGERYVQLASGDITAEVFDKLHDTWVGVVAGQWIVRGAKGEYYPCDDETFFWKYEPVEDDQN